MNVLFSSHFHLFTGINERVARTIFLRSFPTYSAPDWQLHMKMSFGRMCSLLTFTMVFNAFGYTSLFLCLRRTIYRQRDGIGMWILQKAHSAFDVQKNAQNTMCDGHTLTQTRPPLFVAFALVLFASYWNSKNQVRDKSAQTNTGA